MLVVGTSELLLLAQVVQAQAAKIGIKTKIVQVDAETNNARTLAGKFDIQTGFYLWDGPDTILDWWIYSGNIPWTNRVRLRDPRIDSEIEKMRNSATLEVLSALCGKSGAPSCTANSPPSFPSITRSTSTASATRCTATREIR